MRFYEIENKISPIEEGIHDPARYKVVFVIGGPGSGKTFISKKLGLSALGYVNLNSDIAFEYLMKKQNLSTKMPDEEKPQREIARMRAKDITGDKLKLAVIGGLGISIDSTGADFNKVVKLKNNFDVLGYENYLVIINTNLDIARKRNKMRARTVPDNTVIELWNNVQHNIGAFMNMFKNVSIIDNSGDLESTSNQIDNTYKKILNFTKAPNKGKKFTN